MKAYIVTTGIVFALLVIVHLLRIAAEGLGPVKDPFFVISTLVAAGLCGWALRILLSLPRS